MKKLISLFLICMAGWSVSAASPPPPGFGVSFGVFYSNLSPYGDWISVGADLYGWRPHHVAADWRPYTYGRWEWTDDGWYWASDEPWGWAAYHYGRWYYDDYYGWVWIPGYDWAPAWVEWRYGGDYIGWAPLSPYAVFNVSFGIHYRTHWATPNYWWSFTDCNHITAHDMHHYLYRSDENPRYIGRTRDVGSVRYDGGRVVSRGPDRGDVERRGNVRIDRADIVDVSDRGGERVVRGADNRDRIETYRPHISPSDDRSAANRPPSLHQGDRPINLDSRGLDARSREEDLARGRDVRRTEIYRQQREMQLQQDRGRAIDPTDRANVQGRSEQALNRAPVPDRQYMEQRVAPRVQQRDQTRSREPERVMRRPEYQSAPSTRSVPQAAPNRNEGGGQRSSAGASRSSQSGGSRGGGEHRR